MLHCYLDLVMKMAKALPKFNTQPWVFLVSRVPYLGRTFYLKRQRSQHYKWAFDPA